MSKHAVMVVLDLDIELLDNVISYTEIERLTGSKVRTALENAEKGIKVKLIRIKYLGLTEEE